MTNMEKNIDIKDLVLLKKRKIKKYTIDEKLLAIAFLESTQREFDGVMTPQYSQVSELLGMPPTNLKYYWKNKTIIEQQAKVILDDLPRSVAMKISIELLHLIHSLEGTYDDMSNRDKIQLLNTYITKMRLLIGKSTENVAVNYNPIAPK